ncbi:MAG: AtpZ/AtpI family protein [Candidatus Kapaibacterium sp.]|nr:AtpZ/AtpI family protein [Ignavibacteriota bacterium]MCB9220673.1 AtpZ/AtpI family protein [Ignavibacteria bacterium]
MDKDKQNRANIIKELSPYMTLGLDFAITVGLFSLLGYWLDNKFETNHLWVLSLSLFGIIVAFYKFFKVVLKKKNDSPKIK